MDAKSQHDLDTVPVSSNHFLHLIRGEDNTVVPDIILFCQGQAFRAHKLMLSINSRHLYSIFVNSAKPLKTLTISDVTAEILSIILNYFYTGNWQTEFITDQNLMVINEVMNQLDCIQCGELEWEAIFNKLAKIYYFDLWTLAVIYCRKDIEAYTTEFVVKNAFQCSEDKAFPLLTLTQMIAIVSHEEMDRCEEEITVNIIKQWVLHDLNNRRKFVPSLFTFARISAAKKNELIDELGLCMSPIKINSPAGTVSESPKEDCCVVYTGTDEKWSTLLKKAMENPIAVDDAFSPKLSQCTEDDKMNDDSEQDESPKASLLAPIRKASTIPSLSYQCNYGTVRGIKSDTGKIKDHKEVAHGDIKEAPSMTSCFEQMKSSSLSNNAQDTLMLKSERSGKIVVVDIGSNSTSSVDIIKFTSSSEDNVISDDELLVENVEKREEKKEVGNNSMTSPSSSNDDQTYTLSNISSTPTVRSEYSTCSFAQSLFVGDEFTNSTSGIQSSSESNFQNAFNSISIKAKSAEITCKFTLLKEKLKNTINNSKLKLIERSDSPLTNETNANNENTLDENCAEKETVSENESKEDVEEKKSTIIQLSNETAFNLDDEISNENKNLSETKTSMLSIIKSLENYAKNSPFLGMNSIRNFSSNQHLFCLPANNTESSSSSSETNSKSDWLRQNSSYVIDLSIFHTAPKELSDMRKLSFAALKYNDERRQMINTSSNMKNISKSCNAFQRLDHVFSLSQLPIQDGDVSNRQFTHLRDNVNYFKNSIDKSYLMKLCFEHKLNNCRSFSSGEEMRHSTKSSTELLEKKKHRPRSPSSSHRQVAHEPKYIPAFVHYRIKRKKTADTKHDLLTNDSLLVFLMEDHNGVPFRQIYNLRLKKWCPNHLPLLVPEKQGNYSIVYDDDKIFFVGGKKVTDFHCMHNVYVYDCKQHVLRQMPDNLIARTDTSITIMKNTLYIIGGLSVFGKILSLGECYSLSKKNWTLIAPMLFPRAEASIAHDGEYIYMIGGISSMTNDDKPTTIIQCERYDPMVDQWSLIGNLPSYFDNSRILTVIVCQKILAMRKENPNKIYQYTVNKNEWLLLSNVIFPPKYLDIVLPIDDKLYSFQTDLKTVYSLQIPYSEWESETDIPLKLHWRGHVYGITCKEL